MARVPSATLRKARTSGVLQALLPLTLNETVVTAGVEVTVTAVVAVRPLDVAVIVAEPAAMAVTRPLAETVATVAADDDHVVVDVTATPEALRGVAVSCPVCPIWSASVDGATVTEATAAGGEKNGERERQEAQG